MECAICYEKFFTPKTQEECKKLYNENVKDNNCDEIMKFKNLLITPNHNNTHACSTPNCECLICDNCWIKITYGKSIDEMMLEDVSKNYHFTCPYCRQVDWKDCMNNVFIELQEKVLGEEEALEAIFKQCFPNFKQPTFEMKE